MNYSAAEVIDYVAQEDVKFIRLAFVDAFGKQKNVSIMPSELDRAFASGISIDASAIRGLTQGCRSDVFLSPDPSTLQVLPWRPSHGRVVRMLCSIIDADGIPLKTDSRRILIEAQKKAKSMGFSCLFGPECEFCLMQIDENGVPTGIPHDKAGYMDIAPEDKGENIRREICLSLEDMGIIPEKSHHEEGPGQHEIDFKCSAPLSAADNAVTFKAAVRTIASISGLYASFDPKPYPDSEGNGFHINISIRCKDGVDRTRPFLAGILDHIAELTAFLNPTAASYKRLGSMKAPAYISWSEQNRSQLIRIPAGGERMELRSPDSTANPYLAFALLIYAGIDGIERGLTPPPPAELDFFTADYAEKRSYALLPTSLSEARSIAAASAFIHECLPEALIRAYTAADC